LRAGAESDLSEIGEEGEVLSYELIVDELIIDGILSASSGGEPFCFITALRLCEAQVVCHGEVG
jgi:hypothetical protein